jgi:PhnB protein
MSDPSTTRFAPMLYIKHAEGADAIAFYIQAFGANEILRFSNDDGTVHVAELEVEGNTFHLHEETARQHELSPNTLDGTTVVIGLYTEDVDGIAASAEKAGATITTAPKDYEYGMRQAYLTDPFGHRWQIQKRI